MTDRLSVRAVVFGLLFVAVLGIVAEVVVLLYADITPENKTGIIASLTTIVGIAVGAVAGILAHTTSQAPAVDQAQADAVAAAAPIVVPPPVPPVPPVVEVPAV